MTEQNIAQSLFRLTPREWVFSVAYATAIFFALGTLTALWQNPFFIRMTRIGGWDYTILAMEATLLGFYLGVRAQGCGIKRASLGGVLGFLGFGCSICNQILVFLFGATFLLSYFEPVRYLVGFAGVGILGFALYRKLSPRITATPMAQ